MIDQQQHVNGLRSRYIIGRVCRTRFGLMSAGEQVARHARRRQQRIRQYNTSYRHRQQAGITSQVSSSNEYGAASNRGGAGITTHSQWV